MAEAVSAESASAEPAAAAEPVESIENEAETVVKEEDAGEEKSENEGDVAEQPNTGEEPAVSNEQYKALKNITEVLANHKMKIKGDESVHRTNETVRGLTSDLGNTLLRCCSGAFRIDETSPTITKSSKIRSRSVR
jgi:hypothetical protein